MKTNFRYIIRFGFIGLFVIFTCLGCSGVGQKLDKWQTSVTESVKETLNLDDSESSTDAKRKNSEVIKMRQLKYPFVCVLLFVFLSSGFMSVNAAEAKIMPKAQYQKVSLSYIWNYHLIICKNLHKDNYLDWL